MSSEHFSRLMARLDSVMPTVFAGVPAEKSGNPNEIVLANVIVDTFARLAGIDEREALSLLVFKITEAQAPRSDAAAALAAGEKEFGHKFIEEVDERVMIALKNFQG